MLSQKHKTIFVHVRKAGGTSIRSLFPDAVGRFNQGLRSDDWAERYQLYPDFFAFTVVRNPWDRFLSGWHYVKSTRNLSLLEVLENLPKKNMIENISCRHSPLRVRMNYTVAYAGLFFKRYAPFSRRNFARAKRSFERGAPDIGIHDYLHLTAQATEFFVSSMDKVEVDRVLYLEDISNGLTEIAPITGIDPCALTKKNTSTGRPRVDYRSVFDDRAKRLFRKHYARDIELLGYDFDAGPGVAPKNGLTG